MLSANCSFCRWILVWSTWKRHKNVKIQEKKIWKFKRNLHFMARNLFISYSTRFMWMYTVNPLVRNHSNVAKSHFYCVISAETLVLEQKSRPPLKNHKMHPKTVKCDHSMWFWLWRRATTLHSCFRLGAKQTHSSQWVSTCCTNNKKKKPICDACSPRDNGENFLFGLARKIRV